MLAVRDSTGVVQTQYTYEPFGNTTLTGAPSTNAFQYTGRENDGTGLYYYRARYYHPTLQRFISQDPLGFGGGDANLYGYVFNDPVNLTDPAGVECYRRLMLVTAYTGTGPGADWQYYRPNSEGEAPGNVGPNTVAVANSRPKPYPFGTYMTVLGPSGEAIYGGAVHDTGAGWDANHHNVAPNSWIDTWLPTPPDAKHWGKQWREVIICDDQCATE